MFVKFQIKKEFLDLILSGEKKTEYREYSSKILKIAQDVDNALQDNQPVYMILQNGYETAYPWAIVEVNGLTLYHGYALENSQETLMTEVDRLVHELIEKAIKFSESKNDLTAISDKLKKQYAELKDLDQAFRRADQAEREAVEAGKPSKKLAASTLKITTEISELLDLIDNEIDQLIPKLDRKSQDKLIEILDKQVEVELDIEELNSLIDESDIRQSTFERDYNENSHNFFLERMKISTSTPDKKIFFKESDRVHFNANHDLFGFELGEVIANGIGSESYEAAKNKLGKSEQGTVKTKIKKQPVAKSPRKNNNPKSPAKKN